MHLSIESLKWFYDGRDIIKSCFIDWKTEASRNPRVLFFSRANPFRLHFSDREKPRKEQRLSPYRLARNLVGTSSRDNWKTWGALMSTQPVSGVLFNACEQGVQWDLEVVHQTLSNGWTALARPWSSPEEREANGSSFSSQRCLHRPATIQAETRSSKQWG